MVGTWISAVYQTMKEGLLADSTDYASKPLRDQLKRECSVTDVLRT